MEEKSIMQAQLNVGVHSPLFIFTNDPSVLHIAKGTGVSGYSNMKSRFRFSSQNHKTTHQISSTPQLRFVLVFRPPVPCTSSEKVIFSNLFGSAMQESMKCWWHTCPSLGMLRRLSQMSSLVVLMLNSFLYDASCPDLFVKDEVLQQSNPPSLAPGL